jgi:hypothetical protein
MRTKSKPTILLKTPCGICEKACGENDDTCNSGDWFFHHGNALDHSAVSVCELVARNKMNVVIHAAYSPDLALCYFLLCPELKLTLRGRRYITMSQAKLWGVPAMCLTMHLKWF